MKLNGLNCRAGWKVNDTKKDYFKWLLKPNILTVHAKDKKNNKEILELIQGGRIILNH